MEEFLIQPDLKRSNSLVQVSVVEVPQANHFHLQTPQPHNDFDGFIRPIARPHIFLFSGLVQLFTGKHRNFEICSFRRRNRNLSFIVK